MPDPFPAEDESREIGEVNVVPLADVSLVLLIILLVLSPMMTQSMLQIQAAGRAEAAPAQTPQTRTDASAEPVLIVTLTPDAILAGGMSFSGFGEFMSYVQTELPKRTDKKVFVAPHPEVPHGRVVHMLETLKYLGATSVALVQTAETEEPK